MLYTTVQIQIPEGMEPYITNILAEGRSFTDG